jgi:hypothetical protein
VNSVELITSSKTVDFQKTLSLQNTTGYIKAICAEVMSFNVTQPMSTDLVLYMEPRNTLKQHADVSCFTKSFVTLPYLGQFTK